MKKSNYISTAFLVFFFGTIFMMYIDAKAHTTSPKDVKENYHESLTNIDKYSVLVTGKKTKVYLLGSDENKMYESYYTPKDSLKNPLSKYQKRIEYHTNGDTLFIDKTYARQLTIKTKHIKKIIAKENGTIDITNYNSDQLTILSEKSKITGKKSDIKELKIEATNKSKVYFYNSTLDTVKGSAENSKIQINRNKTIKLNFILKNNSDLKTSKTRVLNINTDKSSKYYIYN